VATNTDAQRAAASTAAAQRRIPGARRRSQLGGWMLGTPTELPSLSALRTIAAYPSGFSSIALDRRGATSRDATAKPEKRQLVASREVDQPQVETERDPQPSCGKMKRPAEAGRIASHRHSSRWGERSIGKSRRAGCRPAPIATPSPLLRITGRLPLILSPRRPPGSREIGYREGALERLRRETRPGRVPPRLAPTT
jgi:hypothetical protein